MDACFDVVGGLLKHISVCSQVILGGNCSSAWHCEQTVVQSCTHIAAVSAADHLIADMTLTYFLCHMPVSSTIKLSHQVGSVALSVF